MLPDPDHVPSGFGHGDFCMAVSFNIPSELGNPIVHVGPRDGSIVRARMPGAAVHEDGISLSREGDVCASAKLGQRPIVHPIAVPKGKEGPVSIRRLACMIRR